MILSLWLPRFPFEILPLAMTESVALQKFEQALPSVTADNQEQVAIKRFLGKA